MNNWKHIEHLEDSSFVKFLYSYLLEIRSKIFDNANSESQGSYIVAEEILNTLKFIFDSAP